MNLNVDIINTKAIMKLFAHYLFNFHVYESLSTQCQSILRSLGDYVAGDEKLFHHTGKSTYIMMVPSKPARIGLWVYQLVCTLENGQPFLVHFQMLATESSRGETAPVHEVMTDWIRVMNMFGRPCSLIIYDSYYFSSRTLEVLNAPPPPNSDGAVSGRTCTKFIGCVRNDRYSLTEAFEGRVLNPGDQNSLLVHYYSPDRQVGRKYVLSNAYILTRENPNPDVIPVYDDYDGLFAKCDDFNTNLHQYTWPHKHGGRNTLGNCGTQLHNFAMSSILQNTFNAWFQCTDTDPKSIDFSTNCLLLADEIIAYAATLP
jgi:hypothetical protein